MATTITVDKETRDRLMAIKHEDGYPSIDALVREMLVEYRRRRFREASETFRRRMKEKGLTLRDLID